MITIREHHQLLCNIYYLFSSPMNSTCISNNFTSLHAHAYINFEDLFQISEFSKFSFHFHLILTFVSQFHCWSHAYSCSSIWIWIWDRSMKEELAEIMYPADTLLKFLIYHSCGVQGAGCRVHHRSRVVKLLFVVVAAAAAAIAGSEGDRRSSERVFMCTSSRIIHPFE